MTNKTPENREELLQRMARSGRPDVRFVEGLPANSRSTEAYVAAKTLLDDLEAAGLAVVPVAGTDAMFSAAVAAFLGEGRDLWEDMLAASPYRKEG